MSVLGIIVRLCEPCCYSGRMPRGILLAPANPSFFIRGEPTPTECSLQRTRGFREGENPLLSRQKEDSPPLELSPSLQKTLVCSTVRLRDAESWFSRRREITDVGLAFFGCAPAEPD